MPMHTLQSSALISVLLTIVTCPGSFRFVVANITLMQSGMPVCIVPQPKCSTHPMIGWHLFFQLMGPILTRPLTPLHWCFFLLPVLACILLFYRSCTSVSCCVGWIFTSPIELHLNTHEVMLFFRYTYVGTDAQFTHPYKPGTWNFQ